MVSSAMASYTVDWTFNGNQDFYATAYKCTGACSEGTITEVETELGTSNEINLAGSGTSGNKDTFLFYLYPENICAVPVAFGQQFWGNGHDDKTNAVNFQKQEKELCGSNVIDAHVSKQLLTLGETVTMDAMLQSAWDTADSYATFIPSELDVYYSSYVDVIFQLE